MNNNLAEESRLTRNSKMAAARVLIVDDNRLMQRLLSEILNSSDRLQVVGTASDPYEARQLIKQLDPDVITLDVVMPRMDGITFLKKIMTLKPVPVVMVSTLVEEGAAVTLEAMEIGAVDFIAKPKLDRIHEQHYVDEIIDKVANAAAVKEKIKYFKSVEDASLQGEPADSAANRDVPVVSASRQQIIAIGASTGGTVAIADLLKQVPGTFPAVLIAQHIPPAFSSQFADRINKITDMAVHEAKDGEPILPGHVYIAPGGKHLKVNKVDGRYCCQLDDSPPVNRHRPSVDVLFKSVAASFGKRAIGIILTGMGKDGAKGLKEMKDAGAKTIAQDEKSCVVWGMPKAAINMDAITVIEPLDRISTRLMSWL